MTKETLDFVTHLAAEKLHNFFGVFLQFHIGVDSNIAKIEAFYTINDFFIEKDFIERHVDQIRDIPITIVQGRHDLIVPIKSAWRLSQLLPKCNLFISELDGHSDTSQTTAKKLKEVAKHHLKY